MNNYNVIFESDRILFVKVTDKLIDDYLDMINDAEVQKFIGLANKTITRKDELQWVRDRIKNNTVVFSMIEKETNKFIGNIEMMNIRENTGELGISITKEQQDKHFGQEAIKRILDYAFNELKLEKVELNVYDFNKRAIHCYEKVGFVKDGVGKKPNDIRMITQRK